MTPCFTMYLMAIDIADILNRYGLPVVGVVVLAIFIWRGLWPFLLKHLENTQKMLEDQLAAAQAERKDAMKEFQAERKESMKEFMAAIARRDQTAAESARMNAEALNAITAELRRLKPKE